MNTDRMMKKAEIRRELTTIRSTAMYIKDRLKTDQPEAMIEALYEIEGTAAEIRATVEHMIHLRDNTDPKWDCDYCRFDD